MMTLRTQCLVVALCMVVIAALLFWADSTVRRFGDGGVPEDTFQTALAINGLLGIPFQVVLMCVVIMLGQVTIQDTPFTQAVMIVLGSALWGVIIFVALRLIARAQRKANERAEPNDEANLVQR